MGVYWNYKSVLYELQIKCIRGRFDNDLLLTWLHVQRIQKFASDVLVISIIFIATFDHNDLILLISGCSYSEDILVEDILPVNVYTSGMTIKRYIHKCRLVSKDCIVRLTAD
jgi:hypothetical protein